MTSTMLNALNSGMFLACINDIFITLISKKEGLELVSDYQPISLHSVIYKMVSKVIAN